jgi:hypothetical protein
MGALSISSTSPITATDGVGNALAWCNGVLTFSGAIPTLVANHQANFSFPGSGSFTFSGIASLTITPTAGNFLVVTIQGSVAAGGTNTLGGVSISDSVGDVFSQVVSVGAAGTAFSGALSLLTFIAPAVVGGSTTINASVSGKFSAGTGFFLSVTEVTPFAAGSGLPVFRPIAATDLPGITANSISSGTVPLVFGGTGANLSATGGAHQFVKQGSAGAAFTVGQPDFSDLAGAAGALATSYNGVTLVSNGLPSEVATVDLVGQTAAKATTTLYVVPATGTGQYELSWNAKVTTADAVSSTLGPLTITYADPDGVVQTITTPAYSKAGAPETSDTGNSTTTVLLGVPLMLNCKASTNITYATAYASNTAGAMAYNLHIKLKAL